MVRTECEPDTLDIWQFPLDSGPEQLRLLDESLSADERGRAARFVTSDLTRSFITARGALRRILARYVQEAPAALGFSQNKYGKPFLSRPEASGIEFNLSHSGTVGMVAVSRGVPCGIDVERLREGTDWRAIARREFTPREQALLDAAPDPRYLFFTIWTRKEAVMKGIGIGLSMGPRNIDVSDITSGIRAGAASEWIVRDIIVPDYAAACAFGEGISRLRYCREDEEGTIIKEAERV
jgi:4'-phosphopantetheinyl transferase